MSKQGPKSFQQTDGDVTHTRVLLKNTTAASANPVVLTPALTPGAVKLVKAPNQIKTAIKVKHGLTPPPLQGVVKQSQIPTVVKYTQVTLSQSAPLLHALETAKLNQPKLQTLPTPAVVATSIAQPVTIKIKLNNKS
ncbi:MAG: hypothetical protein JSS07_01645 [Proteobacteria bacterium]|nr:hypothetical protein [Pseudomonadota bacterium]